MKLFIKQRKTDVIKLLLQHKNTMLSNQNIKSLVLILCLIITNNFFANYSDVDLKYLAVNTLNTQNLKVPTQREFKTLEDPTLNFKNDFSKAYWIKLKLNEHILHKERNLLIVNPTTIYRTQVFIPDLNGDIPLASFGRFDINTTSEFSHRSIVFALPENYMPGQEVYFYFYGRTNSKLNIQAWSPKDYHVIDRKYNSLSVFIFSSLFIITLINLIFYYLVIRDKTHLKYIMYLSSFFLFLLVISRKFYTLSIAKYVPFEYNFVLFTYTLVCLGMAFFIQDFLDLKKKAVKLHNFIKLLTIAVAGILLMSVFIHPVPYITFNIVNCMALTFMILVLVFSIKFWLNGDVQAKYFVIAFFPLFVAVSLRLLIILSIIPHSIFSATSFEIAIVIQALTLTFALAHKMLKFQTERDEVSTVLQFDKNISQFLTQVSDQIRAQPSIKYDVNIVKNFFANLSGLVNIKSGSIIYASDDHILSLASNDVDQSHYDAYINAKSTTLKKLSKRKKPVLLKHEEFSLFENNSNILFLPVSMRRNEWGAMLLSLNETLILNDLQKDTLQRYATELIRTLVTSKNLNEISIKANTDDLTQLMNRGAILNALSTHFAIAQTQQIPLSIAFIDIDHFKQINDTYGHKTGDQCLTLLAAHLSNNLPQHALSGRLGGDEFVIVFPKNNVHDANHYLQTMTSKLNLFLEKQKAQHFTLSIGIAEFKRSFTNISIFLEAADEKLYESKVNGRNQITF